MRVNRHVKSLRSNAQAFSLASKSRISAGRRAQDLLGQRADLGQAGGEHALLDARHLRRESKLAQAEASSSRVYANSPAFHAHRDRHPSLFEVAITCESDAARRMQRS